MEYVEPENDDEVSADPLADLPSNQNTCKKCNCVVYNNGKNSNKKMSKIKHKIEYYKKLEENLKISCDLLQQETKKPTKHKKTALTGEALKKDYIIRCDVAFPSQTTSEFVKAQLMDKNDTNFSYAYQTFCEDFYNKSHEAYEFMSGYFRFPIIKQ